MAHKTLIGGTAYEIDGGKTLIGGTAYEIDKGKTLIGGTAYEIGFIQNVVLTINLQLGAIMGSGKYAEIAISGYGTYVADATATHELVVPVGTEIECTIRADGTPINSGIIVNKVPVASMDYPNNTQASYTYIVNSDATIDVRSHLYSGRIEITDANYKPDSIVTVTRNAGGYVDAHYYEFGNSTEYSLPVGQNTVPTGSAMLCELYSSEGKTSYVTVNGAIVKSITGSSVEYYYYVPGDITVDISNYDGYGVITITEQ